MSERNAPRRGPRPPNEAPRYSRGERFALGLDWGTRQLVNASVIVAAFCIVIIVAIGTGDTIGRALFSRSVVGGIEISEALLAVSIFASLAYVQKQQGHIVVDIISNRYGPRLKRIMTIIVLILTLAVFVFLTWRTGAAAARAWQFNEIAQGSLPVPIWLAKWVATISLGIASIESFRQLVRALAGLHPSGDVVPESITLPPETEGGSY